MKMLYRTVKLEKAEVFYREVGDPSDPTVLLLHGYPSSSAQYERLMAQLADRYHLVAPDYPGFGQSRELTGATTFDRLAEVVDEFIHAKGLHRFAIYMFDFGAPVGFRVAASHPEHVLALIIQNGNAYEVGLGPGMQALKPYWENRDEFELAVRGFMTLSATRSQYVDGVPDHEAVNPDLWELDQRYLELPGRDQVMLDLLHDYQNNVTLYPTWQEYMRTHRPQALLPWAKNDSFFPIEGAQAYLADLPDAQIELLDTEHFATATHVEEIAELMDAFLIRHLRAAKPA